MQQQSEEWLAFRKGKLTASKAPIILGLSPYASPFQLWEEELGLREPQKSTPHMAAGLAIEDEARGWFYIKTGIGVAPKVVSHPDNPLFIASLDGISRDNQVILEIKKNNKEFHEMARSGIVHSSHNAQMQHQIYVCSLSECYYLSYRKDDEILLRVNRDNDFIKDMIEKELAFKAMVDDLISPPLTEKDYEDLSHDTQLEDMFKMHDHYAHTVKKFQEKADHMKNLIKTRAGERNVRTAQFKMSKYTVKGRVDWETFREQECPFADVDKYRKTETVSFRITREGSDG